MKQAAYYLIDKQDKDIPLWGGQHEACVQMNKERVDCCITAFENKPTTTLKELIALVQEQFNILLLEAAIRQHLKSECVTMKQARVGKSLINPKANKAKRKKFVKELETFQKEGAFICFFDKTNFNFYSDCCFGRSRKGARAVVKNTPTLQNKSL